MRLVFEKDKDRESEEKVGEKERGIWDDRQNKSEKEEVVRRRWKWKTEREGRR